MIVKLTPNGMMEILDLEDFQRFSVHIDAVAEMWAEIAPAIAWVASLDDAKTAWVDIEALRRRPELSAADRAEAFEKMIEASAPHGWVNPQETAIKAHIVWKSARI